MISRKTLTCVFGRCGVFLTQAASAQPRLGGGDTRNLRGNWRNTVASLRGVCRVANHAAGAGRRSGERRRLSRNPRGEAVG